MRPWRYSWALAWRVHWRRNRINSHPQAAPGSGYWSDPANWLEQFVPDNQLFWDNSKNWTTNYGPAYRDTVLSPKQILACSPQYRALFPFGAGTVSVPFSSRWAFRQLPVYGSDHHKLRVAGVNSELPGLSRNPRRNARQTTLNARIPTTPRFANSSRTASLFLAQT